MNTYEAMFLFNPVVVTDWSAGEAEMRRLLERAGANIIGLKKWDERKLAYEISGQKRGLYGLVFFEAAGDKIAGLENDARLSELMLRFLVLRHDRLTREGIDKMLNAAPPPKSGDRGDSWGRDRGDRGDRPRPEREGAEPEPAAAPVAEEFDTAEAR